MRIAVCWCVLTIGMAQPALAVVTRDDFLVRTTADIVDLCSADPSDPMYTAAIHFCEGYLLGALHYHRAVSSASGAEKLFCAPNPPPSRDEATASFVAWAKANPQYTQERPLDTFFRWLAVTWPCR